MDKVGWIVGKISEIGGYENVGDSVKTDVFGFDIADVSGSIRRFSDLQYINKFIFCNASKSVLFDNLKKTNYT